MVKKLSRKTAATAVVAAAAAAPASGGKDAILPGASPGFAIVGIGASAGGLEAFEAFFRACPADSGMAFVLVPHLDPGHESLLTEILQRATAVPVVQAIDQTLVAPNHVYIIPPNREMAILNGVLQLSVPEQARGMRRPIDNFLCSLAEDQEEDAIGIILSGTATDGTVGLRAILGAGGVCMVQEPATAKYDGMPQSAIAAGCATHILPPEKMPAKLLELTRESMFRQKTPRPLPAATVNGLNQILMQVRSGTGHDFSLYKKSTIGRRVERRMAQNNIDGLAVYARYLKEHPPEVKALFKEMLINVTSFFRDPEAFVAMKQEILPQLLADLPEDYVFRVWVAGCASGEEAYSIAMLLCEFMEETHREFKVQIYATDIDDEAIATARGGTYPPSIAQDVTPERLRRFFIKDDAGFKVKKSIREMVVFAVQSVIKDPPFTRLDLLSCRNLMIYLEPEQQDRLIPSFHYALKPGGVLFLSNSESLTSHPELFSAVNRKWKFYRASHAAATAHASLIARALLMDNAGKAAEKLEIGKARPGIIAELSNRTLLQCYAPASVTTDAKGNILHVHGDTGRYLRPAPGPVTTNVVEMAREGLRRDLGAALNAAARGEPTLDREVSVKTDSGTVTVNFSVRLLPGQHNVAGTPGAGAENLLLVSFLDVAGPAAVKPAAARGRGKRATKPADAGQIDQLERDLASAREALQANLEEQQATNEELKSSNEELQSSNEELQSANEELETSKEELQSLNEETITVNTELNARFEQLNRMQNDMKNLFDNVNVGTLFLDHQLVIRRYTREAQKIYRLIASDVGRPLGDITSNIEGADLQDELQRVLDTLIPSEREVRTSDGAWYLARIQPYRTLDNVIEGVVLTFAAVTDFKLASEAVRRARQLAEGIFNTISEPLIVLDGGLEVVSASRTFYEYFRVTAKETVGRKIFDLGNGQWDIPALRELIEKILPHNHAFEGYVVEHDFPGLGPRRMVLNARRIVTAMGNTELILLAMEAIEPIGTP